MKTFLAMCISGLLLGAVNGLTKHTIQTYYYNQAIGATSSSTQHDTEYRTLTPCNARTCTPHNSRKVEQVLPAARPSLPKAEVVRALPIAGSIMHRNAQARHAGE